MNYSDGFSTITIPDNIPQEILDTLSKKGFNPVESTDTSTVLPQKQPNAVMDYLTSKPSIFGPLGHPKKLAKLVFSPISESLGGESLQEMALNTTEPTDIKPGNAYDYWVKRLKMAGAGTVGSIADMVQTPATYIPIPAGKVLGKIPFRGTTIGEVATKVPLKDFFNKDVKKIVKLQDAMKNAGKGKGVSVFLDETGKIVKKKVRNQIPMTADEEIALAKSLNKNKLQNFLAESKANIPQEDLENISKGIETYSPSTPTTAMSNILGALGDAGKLVQLRGEQDIINQAERAQKIAQSAQAGKGLSGEALFKAQKQSLGGAFEKMELPSLRGKVSQQDFDTLFKVLNDTNLPMGDKITGGNALQDLFEGKLPGKKALDILGEAYPPEFIQGILNNRPATQVMMDNLIGVINLPRAMMASFDLSAPLRQGIFLVGRPEFYKSFGSMFKYFFSPEAYEKGMAEIKSRVTYPLMREQGLALTDIGAQIAKREEAFASKAPGMIPFFGDVFKASNRAYSGFLNKLRADTFDSFIKMAEENITKEAVGKESSYLFSGAMSTPKKSLFGKMEEVGTSKGTPFLFGNKVGERRIYNDYLKSSARFINAATGRGDLPGALQDMAGVLNATFFSPKLMSSRISLLNPYYYATLNPAVRHEAIKSALSLIGIAGTVAGVAKMGGAEVNLDPRNADFLKIKAGRTRYDILGGFSQYARLITQLITGETVSSMTGIEKKAGEGYKGQTRLDTLANFFAAKEAPVPSFITTVLKGKDYSGKTVDIPQEVLKRFIPIMAQDITEVIKSGDIKNTAISGVVSALGVGTQTYNIEPNDLVYISRATTKYAKELAQSGDYEGAKKILDQNKNEIYMSMYLEPYSDRRAKLVTAKNKLAKNILLSPEAKRKQTREIDRNIALIDDQMSVIVEQHKQMGDYK